MPCEEADIDFFLIGPASVSRRVVKREALPDLATDLSAVDIRQKLAAVDAQIIGPPFSVVVDPVTNRFSGSGYTYDANGNLTATSTLSMAYDVANRVTSANGDTYVYGPRNERLMKNGEVYFYSPDGRRMGAYQMVISFGVIGFNTLRTNVYFAGKLIRESGEAVVVDRLGSVRVRGSQTMSYFPYGEERTSTANNFNKFGTYHRDAGTGLDYADQRYYSSIQGRFLSPDPYQSSGGPADPQSWNRYAYVLNDPINYNDPTGEIAVTVGPGGVFIPATPIVFIANVFLQIFGGGGTIRHPGWQTDAQVNAQVAARERAFWEDHEDDGEDSIQNPMFLKMIEDCYKTQIFKSSSLVRRRRYQVLDEWGKEMRNPGAVRVQERHDVRFSPRDFVTGGVWSQDSPSPLNRDGMFDDFISVGSGGDFWSYQSFTGSSPGNVNRPLMVIDGANMWTTLGIHATRARININGNDGPRVNGKLKECDTPDIR
jgi:RHS repeat-associated protein